MKKFWNWIRSLFGWKPDPVEEPVVTEPDPVEPESEYTITKVWANGIRWSGPDLTWTPRAPETCGEVHLYRADGRGGKFDHVRHNTHERDWKNIPSYGCWPSVGEPEKGEQCELWLVKYGGGERVKVGVFAWPR